jgi:hypothetical protein
MTATILSLFSSIAHLLVPLLMLIAVGMMARKVPARIFTCMLIGSVLRVVGMLPFIVLNLQGVLGSGASPPYWLHMLAGAVGALGGLALAVGLLGLATGLPFAAKHNCDGS